MRFVRSSIQDANGFSETNDLLSHAFGTEFEYNEVAIFSKSSDMTINPFNAFFSNLRETIISPITPLYRIHSYISTVFIDSVYIVGYLMKMDSQSNNKGVFP